MKKLIDYLPLLLWITITWSNFDLTNSDVLAIWTPYLNWLISIWTIFLKFLPYMLVLSAIIFWVSFIFSKISTKTFNPFDRWSTPSKLNKMSDKEIISYHKKNFKS